MVNRLLIGISVCLMHPDATRRSAPSKTLQFIEQSTAHWVMSGGAIPVLIPSPHGETARGDITCADYALKLDGLVLHGGADIWPVITVNKPSNQSGMVMRYATSTNWNCSGRSSRRINPCLVFVAACNSLTLHLVEHFIRTWRRSMPMHMYIRTVHCMNITSTD